MQGVKLKIASASAADEYPRMGHEQIDNEAVGRRLRAAREALGFAEQSVFADVIGCNRSNYSQMERGQRALPPRFAMILRHRWGVTFDYLYAGALSGLPASLHEKLSN